MHTGSIYGDSRWFHRQPVMRPSWQTCDDKKTNPASYSASVSRFVDSAGGGNRTWNETRRDETRSNVFRSNYRVYVDCRGNSGFEITRGCSLRQSFSSRFAGTDPFFHRVQIKWKSRESRLDLLSRENVARLRVTMYATRRR